MPKESFGCDADFDVDGMSPVLRRLRYFLATQRFDGFAQ